MPAEESVGLRNQERLLPMADSPCKHHQKDPIRPGIRWALDLAAEDDQLLTEERVFGDEFSLGAVQIIQCSHEEGAACWPRPPQYTLLDPTEQAPIPVLERHEQKIHRTMDPFQKRDDSSNKACEYARIVR